jgi:alpha-glucosidase
MPSPFTRVSAGALALLWTSSTLAAPTATASSPDGSISVKIETDNDGRTMYSVTRKGKILIAPSRLGFLLTDSEAMVRGFSVAGSETAKGDETWQQPWGERTNVRNRYNELLVRMAQPSGLKRTMNVRFRLFDNGMGFRYEMPKQPTLTTMKIAEEVTEFNLVTPGTAWWATAQEWNREEYLYNRTPINAVSAAQTPFTMKLDDGTHLSFHEAALVDYSGMWIKRIEGQSFRALLSPSATGPKVVRGTPFSTPWRTIRISDDAKGLYNNDLELNLNEPNKLGDVSWVKPMRYIGIWWGMHLDKYSWAQGPKHGATTVRAKAYIDFAATNGFGGVLIEGWNKGWDGNWFGHGDEFSFTESTPDFDLKAVTDYGRSKDVALIGHHETGGNIAVYEAQLEDAMALYQRMGVPAVKSGYVADAGGIIAAGDKPGEVRMEWHEGQVSVVHHLKVVETAARHKIAVNPHEPVKDTGLRRTYPNWVSREGQRGMEYNAWGQPDNGPEHEVDLIFTRMLSGPMDYTPGVLSLVGKNEQGMASTMAKQLALYLVLYSPIQMAADLPENLIKHPKELAFIGSVPVDWSESAMLSGEVGQFAVIARKAKATQDWYVGGVTNRDARTAEVALDFLDAGKRYTATVYRDGPNADYRKDTRADILIETKAVKKGDRLSLPMGAGGGFAIKIAAGK